MRKNWQFPRWVTRGVTGCAMLAVTSSLFADDDRLPLDETGTTDTESAYFREDDSTSGTVSLAAMQQPAEDMTPRTTPPRPTPRRVGVRGSQQANIRLADVPNMFGDVFMTNGRVFALDTPSGNGRLSVGGFDIPGAGGSRRVKIGENNKAMPMNRVFFMYNHFENALTMQDTPVSPPGQTLINQGPIDRYTLGIEKMFFDDLWSCEVRMPFNSAFDAQTPAFGANGGNVGNLSVILKNLLYVDDYTSVAAGLGLNLPTGSDFEGRVGTSQLSFENDSFHILPYIGFVTALDEVFFVQGFWQIDVATSGNEVLLQTGANNQSLGYLNDQNLMYLDLAVGGWLYHNPYAERLTGLALLGELHYTTTLQNSDQIRADDQGTQIFISNPFNRQDITNGTVALQFEIANTTTFRIATVLPLGERPDQRFFDSEVQFQVNRKF